MDVQAIAQAIAARFAPAAVTPPSGLQNIRLATEDLPQVLNMTPAVLVFPPDESFSYTPGSRQSAQDWPVRFYLANTSGLGRAVTDLYRWRSVLIGQILPQSQLGQSGSGGVAYAVMAGARIGRLIYEGVEFEGVDMVVRVRLAEAISPVA